VTLGFEGGEASGLSGSHVGRGEDMLLIEKDGGYRGLG
jgi:hypothetical protein